MPRGIKKWRKIDDSQLQTALKRHRLEDGKPDSDIFVIDKEGSENCLVNVSSKAKRIIKKAGSLDLKTIQQNLPTPRQKEKLLATLKQRKGHLSRIKKQEEDSNKPEDIWVENSTKKRRTASNSTARNRNPRDTVLQQLPSVILPHPGQSYNPTEIDLENCVKEAAYDQVLEELDKEKVNQLSQPMTNILTIVKPEQLLLNMTAKDKQRLAFLISNFPKKYNELLTEKEWKETCKDITTDEGFSKRCKIKPITDNVDSSNRTPTTSLNALSKQQRKARELHKAKQDASSNQKDQKQFLHQINTVGAILKSIRKSERDSDLKLKKKQENKHLSLKAAKSGILLHPPRIGRARFKEAEIPTYLPSERTACTTSLRLMKPPRTVSTNLALDDRYYSMQRRYVTKYEVKDSKYFHKKKSQFWRLRTARRFHGVLRHRMNSIKLGKILKK